MTPAAPVPHVTHRNGALMDARRPSSWPRWAARLVAALVAALMLVGFVADAAADHVKARAPHISTVTVAGATSSPSIIANAIYSGQSSSSQSVNTHASTAIGDLLVFIAYAFNGSTTASYPSISLPSGFTQHDLANHLETSRGKSTFLIAYREAPAAGVNAYSSTFVSDGNQVRWCVHMLTVRGHRPIAQGNPFHSSAAGSVVSTDTTGAASRSITVPALTTTRDYCLGLGLGLVVTNGGTAANAQSGWLSQPSGWTNYQGSGSTVATGNNTPNCALAYATMAGAQTKGAAAGTYKTYSGNTTYDFDQGRAYSIMANATPGVPGSWVTPAGAITIPPAVAYLLDWNAATDIDGTTITYQVDYRLNGGGWATLASEATVGAASQYSWTPAATGQYEFRTWAYSGGEWSAVGPTSAVVTVAAGGPRMIVG